MMYKQLASQAIIISSINELCFIMVEALRT